MKISDESKVGIFVLVTLIILILGYNFMRGKNLFESRDTYHVYYDNVAGLEVSSAVLVKGHKIGLVNKIVFMEDKDKRFKVSFSIKDKFPVPTDSKARIINHDIMGTKALEIVLGKEPTCLEKNDTLAGEAELSITEIINNVVSPITNKTNKILKMMDEFLSSGGKENIQEAFINISKTSEELSKTTKQLNDYMISKRLKNIMVNIENISGNLEGNSGEITNVIKNLSDFSDSLKYIRVRETIDQTYEVMSSIEDISHKINNGEGSLGLLVNNDSLYHNLNSASENLNALIVDLKMHPEDYVNISVFGKKTKSKKE